MARKHTEDEVLKSLSKKHDVKIYPSDRIIMVLNGKSKSSKYAKSNDLGNGSWGKIDYLVNYHNYTLNFVAEY